VPTHRFGYRHRTTRLKILYTTAFTSRRTRRSFSTVTKFITTRRGIRIRTHQLISFGSHANKWIPYDRFSFKPERFLGDTTTCAESSNLANAMDRDHWAFGAGYVQNSVFWFGPAVTHFIIADVLFELVTAAAFVRESTSQNGSCGLRSHGCFGLLTFDRCPMSLYPSMDITANLDASRNHFVSLSHRDMIECRHCLREKRKFR